MAVVMPTINVPLNDWLGVENMTSPIRIEFGGAVVPPVPVVPAVPVAPPLPAVPVVPALPVVPLLPTEEFPPVPCPVPPLDGAQFAEASQNRAIPTVRTRAGLARIVTLRRA
jgi:hypothetical protein